MEHRALAALIVRIAGLLIVVSAITNAAKSFGPLFHPDSSEKIGLGLLLLSAVVSVIIPVVLGLVLIYFPGAVTTKVLRIEGIETRGEIQVRPLQQVAFAAIGLWLVVYAILDSIYIYAKTRIYIRLLEEMPAYVKPPSISPDDFAGYVSSGVQLLIGILLLVGSRGLANAISRLRG
jgi:hypothetical protein